MPVRPNTLATSTKTQSGNVVVDRKKMGKRNTIGVGIRRKRVQRHKIGGRRPASAEAPTAGPSEAGTKDKSDIGGIEIDHEALDRLKRFGVR